MKWDRLPDAVREIRKHQAGSFNKFSLDNYFSFGIRETNGQFGINSPRTRLVTNCDITKYGMSLDVCMYVFHSIVDSITEVTYQILSRGRVYIYIF